MCIGNEICVATFGRERGGIMGIVFLEWAWLRWGYLGLIYVYWGGIHSLTKNGALADLKQWVNSE